MFRIRSLMLILLLVIIPFGAIYAQSTDSCGVLADTMLESAQAACGDVGINEVCHASSPVVLTLPDGVSTDFESGDTVDLSEINSLSTVDAETGSSSGIAIANAQMNLSEASDRSGT